MRQQVNADQHLSKWNFIYGNRIPVIAYLDTENLLVGFDFWGADQRTKVMTRFFNTAIGSIDEAVFESFPCE